MNFRINRQKAPSHLKIPSGLQELMRNITKEVIKMQPKNMEAFIADYLETILKSRESRNVVQGTIDDVLNASLYLKEIQEAAGIDLEKAKLAVKIISEEFEKHFSKASPDCGNWFLDVEIVVKLINEVGLTMDQAKKAVNLFETIYGSKNNRKMKLKVRMRFFI